MPTLTIPNSFSNGDPIQASEHNANYNAIATLLNSAKLDADNLQDNAITTAKITDLNVTEAKLAAAVVAKLLPPGVINSYGGTSAPTGWLLCDGSAVSRSTYSALFTVIGENFGQGDNSTTFNLPDFRGRFLRGRDGAAGVDPDAATRTAMATGGNTGDNVGSVQGDEYKQHNHGVTDPGHAHTYDLANNAAAGGIIGANGIGTPGSTYSNTTGITINNAGTSSETRPKNAYVNFIIKT